MFPADASTEDVQALVDLVGELERSPQQEDVEGFLALFDPAAVWVTGAGRRLIGLEVIASFTREVLPRAMANGSVTYRVDHVAFVNRDVALTGVDQEYTDFEGSARRGSRQPHLSVVEDRRRLEDRRRSEHRGLE